MLKLQSSRIFRKFIVLAELVYVSNNCSGSNGARMFDCYLNQTGCIPLDKFVDGVVNCANGADERRLKTLPLVVIDVLRRQRRKDGVGSPITSCAGHIVYTSRVMVYAQRNSGVKNLDYFMV